MAENSKTPRMVRNKFRLWRKRILWTLLLAPVLYLVLTGPALWSRSLTRNDTWRKSVIYFVAPVMWVDHQFRDRSLVEQIGLIDLRREPNTTAYRWLTGYWSLFGEPTLSEADRVALLLKLRFGM